MTTPAFRCSDAARDRDDQVLGTAPIAEAYLLIEHPGPWRFDALAGAEWPTDVMRALARAVRLSRGRLLLIRRPGRRSADAVRRWAVVRVGGGTRWGFWREAPQLHDAAAALLAAAELTTPPAPEPLLLVCAHGVHDACCAIRGRPVAATLARRWPEETWECSHVGGDRFAANVVVLPDGTYYGGLDGGSVTAAVEGHFKGRVELSYLRGSVRWPPVAQVAVGEVHRRLGPLGPVDVRADRWAEQSPGSWFVEVSVIDGRRFGVRLTADQQAPARLTCAARRATAATTYRVDAMSPL